MSVPTAPVVDHGRPSPVPSAALVWLPLLVAVTALAGSLWLSLGMKLKACPLCFYQRTFVMGVVAVLGVGLLTGPRHRGVLNLLALPLTVAGFGVALFHVYLEVTGKLECPAGLLGVGTAPQQSLAVLTLLLALVAVGSVRGGGVDGSNGAAAVVGVVLGVALAVAAVTSAPPPAPPKSYDVFDTCRPPLRPQ
jgi:disulfide bond formation protein DsbB